MEYFLKESVDFGTKTMLESFTTNKENAKVADNWMWLWSNIYILSKKIPDIQVYYGRCKQ